MHRSKVLLAAVLAALVSYGCTGTGSTTSAPAAQGTAEDETVLRGLAEKYTSGFNAGDANALAQMVTEDFENITAEGTHTQGRAAFLAMEQEGIKQRTDAGMKLTLSTTTGYLNWIDANHAVIGGTYQMAGLPPGAPDKGAWIVVCEKSADGQWLMQNSLVAEAPLPPPPAPPAK
jgi:uncharacterized protein (TIGR02246 family)